MAPSMLRGRATWPCCDQKKTTICLLYVFLWSCRMYVVSWWPRGDQMVVMRSAARRNVARDVMMSLEWR